MSVTLITTLGDLKLELFCKSCPKSSKNFIGLCATGYYNETFFNRNVPAFILQGGTKTGKYSEDQSFYGKSVAFEDEITSELKHNKRGIVAFANKGPNTNKSQFYITYSAQPQLDLKSTIFAHVIDGFDVLDLFEAQEVDQSNMKPLRTLKILDTKIHANPFAEDLEF
ncbi:MAG: Peptidyl-prolyl cis-trans isomerase-like 3 [Marteilia pararefringens]